MAAAGPEHLEKLRSELAAAKRELAAKVKHYEGKLVTLTVINGALQSENEKLKEELEKAVEEGGRGGARSSSEAEQELKELHAEFTRRLGAAEKTAHAMKEECFALRRQVEELRRGNESCEAEIAEKDAAIVDYKREGETLARRVGELEATLAKAKAENARLEQEKERLSSRVQVLEAAAQSVDASRAAALEGSKQELVALQHSLHEQREHFNKLLEEARAQAMQQAAQHQEELRMERHRASQQVEEREHAIGARTLALQQALLDAEHAAAQNAEQLRQEIHRLERQNLSAEEALAEAQASISEATRPLIRQMEGLVREQRRLEALLAEQEQASRAERERSAAETERLTAQLARAEQATALAAERAQAAEGAAKHAKAEMQAAEARMRQAQRDCQALRQRQEEAEARAICAEDAHREAMAALSSARSAREEAECSTSVAKLEIEALSKQLQELQMAHPRANGLAGLSGSAVSLELRGASTASAASSEKGDTAADGRGARDGAAPRSPSSSKGPPDTGAPGTPGAAAPAEGTGRAVKHTPGSGAPPGSPGMAPSPSAMAAPHGGAAILVEKLSSKVRLLQGEVAQLQKQLDGAQAGREHAEEELLRAQQRLMAQEKAMAQVQEMGTQLADLQRRHDMALVLIGERNERVEELEQDMADVKTMYREQVNLLVQQVDPNKWPDGYRICLFCPHCAQSSRARHK